MGVYRVFSKSVLAIVVYSRHEHGEKEPIQA